jgi:hypothetical protein
MKYGTGQGWKVSGVEVMLSSSKSLRIHPHTSVLMFSYEDWIRLNEPRILPLSHRTRPLDLSTYSEAIGDLLHMHLTIDRPTDKPHPEYDAPVTSNIPTGDLLPPIHFHGHSSQSGGTWPTAASSFVKGTVQLTTDSPPQVRWTMIIRYGGEDRWRIESVQVGGRGSKRGFFGVSFDLSVIWTVIADGVDMDRCFA